VDNQRMVVHPTRPEIMNNKSQNLVQPLNIHYALEIDGVQWGIFNQISGGDMEIDVIDHNVVFENGGFVTLHIPGPMKTQPIKLESGYGNTKDLYLWFIQVKNGDINGARKNATISLNAFIDGKYQAVVQWHLINAWPSKVNGLDLEQGRTELARFSITLVCESNEREDIEPAKK
jgi:phage tail-like protein